jgi:AcrR family transcriptional regulator
MAASGIKPTRREERRSQTVREIKDLAMGQISAGGPDAVSLSGIVREMSMSPAAVYRYFDSRDALLADLVVDAYNDLADSLAAIERGSNSVEAHLAAVLTGSRRWALENPNAYRLIFHTDIGSGKDFAVGRTVPAASRSMAVVVAALAAVADQSRPDVTHASQETGAHLVEAITTWAEERGLADYSAEVLRMGLLSWTRLHGILSLEIGGHLAATGIGADGLFEAEVAGILRQASLLAPLPT